jgi:hypothetical protein
MRQMTDGKVVSEAWLGSAGRLRTAVGLQGGVVEGGSRVKKVIIDSIILLQEYCSIHLLSWAP